MLFILFSKLSTLDNISALNKVTSNRLYNLKPESQISKKVVTLSEVKYSYLFLSSNDARYRVNSASHSEYLINRKGYSYSNSLKKFLVLFIKFKKFMKNLFSQNLKFACLSGKLLARTAYTLNRFYFLEYSNFYELSSQKSFYDRRGLRRLGKLLVSTLKIDNINTLILFSSDTYAQLEQTLSTNRLFLIGLTFSNATNRNLDVSLVSSSKNVASWLLFSRLISHVKVTSTYDKFLPKKSNYKSVILLV